MQEIKGKFTLKYIIILIIIAFVITASVVNYCIPLHNAMSALNHDLDIKESPPLFVYPVCTYYYNRYFRYRLKPGMTKNEVLPVFKKSRYLITNVNKIEDDHMVFEYDLPPGIDSNFYVYFENGKLSRYVVDN